jgi:hypothetical protein
MEPVLPRPSLKQQVNVPLKAYDASICFESFKCFRYTLQMFHMDVVKVDPNIAYIVMAMHVCCKCLFPNVSSTFRRMLRVFYLDVAYVSHICCIILQWFQVFSNVLQVFHSYVLSVSAVCDICCKCLV